MDFPHHLGLGAGKDLRCCRRRAKHLTENQSILSKLREDDAVDDAAAARVVAIGVERLRDQSIFLNEIVNHVPLSTIVSHLSYKRLYCTNLPSVTQGFFDQCLNESRVEVMVGGRDYLLQEPVTFLQFIPEKQIGL